MYYLYVRHTHAHTIRHSHREHIIIIFIYSRRQAACNLFVHPPTEIVAESDRTVKRDFEPNRTRVKRYIEYLIRVYYYLVFMFGRTIFTHKHIIPTIWRSTRYYFSCSVYVWFKRRRIFGYTACFIYYYYYYYI